ncbi:hypothetical protein J6590_040855 [Homalodisca vitripennis]|nr:hypothetical protein J6590_040855 [Homalodisca vitripennis]
MSAGVAVVFKKHFGKPTMDDCVASNLTCQELEDGATVYSLVTKERFFDKPTLHNYNIAFRSLAEHFKMKKLLHLICSPMGCTRDKIPLEFFISNLVKFQESTGANITIVTKDEVSNRVLRDGLSHEQFVEQMNCFINQYTNKNKKSKVTQPSDLTPDTPRPLGCQCVSLRLLKLLMVAVSLRVYSIVNQHLVGSFRLVGIQGSVATKFKNTTLKKFLASS